MTMAAALLTAGLINRSLGPSGRGVYAEMQTWVAFFTVMFGISIDSAIYHFSNRTLYGGDDKSRFVTIFLLSLSLSLLAAAGLTIFVIYFPEHVSAKTSEYILFLDVLLILSMLASTLIVFVQALGNIRFSALIGMAQSGVNVVVISSGYILGIINLFYVVISLIAVQTVSLAILSREFWRSGYGTGRFSKTMVKGIITAGMKQHIATVSTFVYMKVNQLIVFRYCGESEAGVFAVALNLALYLTFLLEILRNVLYPRVIHSSDDYEVTVRSLRLGFYGWGIVVLLLILLSKPIVLIYAGRDFISSVNVFRILLIAVWFLSLSSLLAPYYIKAGAFTIASVSAVFLGTLSVTLNFLLVPRYLSKGAAFATSLTCLTGFGITYLFLWYLSRRNPSIIFKPDFNYEFKSLKSWARQWGA